MLSTNTQLGVSLFPPLQRSHRTQAALVHVGQWSLQYLEGLPVVVNPREPWAIPRIATGLWSELARRHPPEERPRGGAAGRESGAGNSGSKFPGVETVAVAAGLGNHGDREVCRFLERRGNGPTCFRRGGS